jgi:hypothetical protein
MALTVYVPAVVPAGTATVMLAEEEPPGASVTPVGEKVVVQPGDVEERFKVLEAHAVESLFVTVTVKVTLLLA